MTSCDAQSVPPSRRRWLQFSLRTLLIAVLLASVEMSWVGVKMQRVRQQRAAVKAIEALGGEVEYDYVHYHVNVAQHKVERQVLDPPGPAWLRAVLGDCFFATVVAVDLRDAQVTDAALPPLKTLSQIERLNLSGTAVTDAGLEHLKALAEVRSLGLAGTRITDAGLDHLKGYSHLSAITLNGTTVTADGIDKLRRALPNCTIVR